MKRLVVFAFLAFLVPAQAQTPLLRSGSTVFIEPMEGYEVFLAAAFQKRHVPIVVVTDKPKAQFVIDRHRFLQRIRAALNRNQQSCDRCCREQ